MAGAFTGAVSDRPGRFRQADGGTLFLDEIDTASPALQVRLLRAIQDREFEPVGGGRTERVDVRLIVATNKDLEGLVREGEFREDLYYRVNVITLTQPPLRGRSIDIPLLVQSFRERFANELGRPVADVDPAAMECLCEYHWPGNVRELVNVIERAVVLCRGEVIRLGLFERHFNAPGQQFFLPPHRPDLGTGLQEELALRVGKDLGPLVPSLGHQVTLSNHCLLLPDHLGPDTGVLGDPGGGFGDRGGSQCGGDVDAVEKHVLAVEADPKFSRPIGHARPVGCVDVSCEATVGHGAVHRTGIDVVEAQPFGQSAGRSALARSGRSVDRDNHLRNTSPSLDITVQSNLSSMSAIS